MRWNDTLMLISTTITTDDVRNQRETKTERKVFANIRSMGINARMAASIDDYSRLKMFEILSVEYDGEEKLNYDGVEYDIMDASVRGDRTYITAKKTSSKGAKP